MRGGRSQAADLTGMLSQLANSVGEMGGAHDYLAQNIRDHAAPKIDTNSPESLTAYSEYARRNGNPQDAQKYAQMATDLGIKQQAAKATGTLANLQASASNMNRLLADPTLTEQNRATIRQNLDVVLTQMNTVGANNAQNGGTGLEGEQHRKALKKESDDAILVDLKIQERRQQVGEALSKGQALNEGIFPPTESGKAMWSQYQSALDMIDATDTAAIAKLNATYSPFLTAAITDQVKASELTHKATYDTAVSQFNADMQGHITKLNAATTEEEREQIRADMEATKTKAAKTFAKPEYSTYNNVSLDEREAAAAASVTAIADKGLARLQAQSDYRTSLLGEEGARKGLTEQDINIEILKKTNQLKALQIPAAQVALSTAKEELTATHYRVLKQVAEYGDYVESGAKMTRDQFLTDKDYEAYSAGYDNTAGPNQQRAYNKRDTVKALVNRKVTAIEASKVLPGLAREVHTSLNKLAEKYPVIADAIESAVGDDNDITNYAGQNILETVAEIEGEIRANYEMLPPPERTAMVDQAVMDYLTQFQPGLIKEMREEVKDTREGVTGTTAQADRATAKDERRDRIIGEDKLMGTGSYYLKKLAAAQKKHGKYFDKAEFDAAYEAQVISPITGPQDEQTLQSTFVGAM